jgi:zinc D-Ala-D-Ala carboxypeptidase
VKKLLDNTIIAGTVIMLILAIYNSGIDLKISIPKFNLNSVLSNARRHITYRQREAPKEVEDSSETFKSTTVSFVHNPTDTLALVNKSYRFNEGYVPGDLVRVNIPFAGSVIWEERLMRREAAEALEKLFESASKQNIQLRGISGYRSYETQRHLYYLTVRNMGVEYAENYVAYPGHSEHQSGLAMDLVGPVSYSQLSTSDFGNTKEGKWVEKNAHSFGFIIRYPEGKEKITGYNYEPWHLRYVGIEAAREIKEKGLVLEEYIEW